MIIQDDVLNISHSTLSSFDSCPRKFEFSKLRGLSGFERSLAADVGTCLHTGYQNYVVTRDAEAAIWAMMKEYPIDLNSNPTDFRSVEACYATLMAMIHSSSLMEFEVAEIEGLDGIIRPAVEVPFVITIKNFELIEGREIKIQYRGFIDLILFSKITGEYVVIDIKTTRDNSHDLSAKFRYDEQCVPYAILLERILNNPIDALTVKYLSTYIDIKDPRVTPYTFHKSEMDVHDWARGVKGRLEDIKKGLASNWFRRNPNSCMAYKRPCKHFEICNSRQDTVIEKTLGLMDKSEEYNRRNAELDNAWVRMDLELV